MVCSISKNIIDIFEGKGYYAVSIALVLLAIFLFVFVVEKRKMTLRNVVLIAVLVSLAVAGRLVFFMLPQFKPCAAIVIIAGIMLGKEAGVLTGMLTAFVSNFFFGQGPWTPWQMVGFGAVGLVAALVFNGNILKTNKTENKILLSVFGFVVTVVVYGLIVDTGSVFMMLDKPTMAGALSIYGAGVIFNITHGVATAVFLWLLANPLMKKIERVENKYIA